MDADAPSEREPLWVTCPACAGQRCDACGGMGRWRLTTEPRAYVKPWAWTVIEIADRYRKGLPPVAGGSLDQTHWINQACTFVDSERQSHLAESGALAMLFM